MGGLSRERRKYARQPRCTRFSFLSFSSSSPGPASYSATMRPHSPPDSAVSLAVALKAMQHRPSRTHDSVAAAAIASRLGPWNGAMKLLLLCSAVLISPVLLGSCQTAAQSHVSNNSIRSHGRINHATSSVGISDVNSRNHSIIGNFGSGRSRGRGKFMYTTGRSALSPNRGTITTAESSSLHLETTGVMQPEGMALTAAEAPQEELLDMHQHSLQRTRQTALPLDTAQYVAASASHMSAAYAAGGRASASSVTRGGSRRKLHSISNHMGEHHSILQFRDRGKETAVSADYTVPVRSRTVTGDTDFGQSSFLHATAVATTAQPPLEPTPAASAVSSPALLVSSVASVPQAPEAVSQTTSPAIAPLAGLAPAAAQTLPAVAPTIETPVAVTEGTGALVTTVTPVVLTGPGTVAVSPVPTPTAALAPAPVVTPQGVSSVPAGGSVPLTMSTGAALTAAGGTGLPIAVAPVGAAVGGSIPLSVVLPGQPQPVGAPTPAQMPPAPVVSVTTTPTGEVSMPQEQPVPQTQAPVQQQPQPQEDQKQQQQRLLVSRQAQQAVQKHGATEPEVQPEGGEAAVKAHTPTPSVPVHDKETRVTPAVRLSTFGLGASQRLCFDACECWPIWASSIAALVLYSAATLAAVLLTAGLFSKGLQSSSFYKGGGYWLIGASAVGAVTGALIGGLVSRCVGAALGLAAGMMCLSASLVLLGSRGAWLGALGGVMTGGVIGAMTNGGATTIGLGSGIGVLVGVICGFVPLARQLKMNERYIRRGMVQGAASVSESASRTPSKRAISRSQTSRTTKEHFRRSLEPAGSSSEDARTLAVQRLSSNPVSRIRSSMGFATTASFSSNGRGSIESDFGSTFPARETDTGSTAHSHDSPNATSTSAGESSHAA